jgi:alkanesulfonate monooxygenase SsuD/methylene tetrahydromethanopterin reductase-like flavin-dependent oxidoreductase (luciferase family)
LEYCINLMDATADPVAWAREREAEGWDVIGVADHINTGGVYPHLWVTATQLAMATSRPRIGSIFANNLFRSPVEFAQASLALQRASNGRFDAGLGAGWNRDEMERSSRVFPDGPTRAGMYKEAILIVRDLITTGQCTFRGEYYSVDIAIGPVTEVPPRLIAAPGGPRTIREVSPLVDVVEIKAAGKGTRSGSLDFATIGAITHEDLQRQIEQVRAVQPTAPIGLFVLAATSGPRVELLQQLWGAQLYGGFVGHPEKVVTNFRRLEEMGISRIEISPMDPDTASSLAPYLFGERGRGAGHAHAEASAE